ncbi:MAG: class I SAM-dependent methyltransferase, partial [Candidatus Lindowbacteria bacterium]|nr:class I SAM-dependent methyltransferase [Candidatus Lindowbacteria bacterium]
WHPVVKACVAPKLKFITERVPLTKETRILDVGAGNGTYSYYLRQLAECFAVDSSPKLLKQNPCRKALADALRLPFKDDTFDLTIAACLLHHVPDPLPVVAELSRVSRRYVVLIEPNRANPAVALFSLLVRHERGGLAFSRAFLRRCAETRGLLVKHLFCSGMIFPNKMPEWMLPPLKVFDRNFPFGMNTVLIAEKQGVRDKRES